MGEEWTRKEEVTLFSLARKCAWIDKNRRKVSALFKPTTREAYDDPRAAEIVRPLVLLEREKFARGFFVKQRDAGYSIAEFQAD